ncbi:MAG: folylpolyglutamate synthase/dihydrofolate synthase family protein [Planctomycetaceae bacterium]|nr:folylpolyglutamate synthase/dihydrofolate synthase family protein [Planctomycetaceae bacterium]
MTALDTYEQAIEYLYGRINFERIHSEAYTAGDFKLDRMRLLLERIGNPPDRIPAVHVAGTKGKGSTCTMIASILTQAGYRTGLYTSPHLIRYEERFVVDGTQPEPHVVVDLVNRIRPHVAAMDRLPARMHPTYFEITTALAWMYFEDSGVELAVLETGLGGRLDCTNLCRPLVTVITNISRDHTQLLGSTVREIAGEKAGILKDGVPVISGVSHPDAIDVIRTVSRECEAPLWLLGTEIAHRCVQAASSGSRWQIDVPGQSFPSIPVSLRGEHQGANAALAIAAIVRLREAGWDIPAEAIDAGMLRVRWPARVEEVGQQPSVILDAAHNWESAKALVHALSESPPSGRRILVFATTRDKDYRGLVRILLPHFDTIVITKYLENPRGVPIEELESYIATIANRPVHLAADPYAAWKLASKLATVHDQIVVTGSFFLIAELRELILDDLRSSPEPQPSGSEFVASNADQEHAP